MSTPLWITKMLDRRGVNYEVMHHPDAYTAQEVAQREHISGHRMAKVVVVIADGRPVELIVPASRHVSLDRVQTILDAEQVRLATENEMEKFFDDCEVGAIPPLRHWANVRVLMDRALKVEGEILFQAGTHTEAIRLNFRDWYEMVNPQVATISEPAKVVHA